MKDRKRLRIIPKKRNTPPEEPKKRVHGGKEDYYEDFDAVEAERKKFFLTELDKAMGIVIQACRKTNIPREQYNRWMRSDAEFARYVEEVITPNAVEVVESKMMSKILDKDNPDRGFIQFYLSRKGTSKGYGDRVALVGPDGGAVKVEGKFELLADEVPLEAAIDALKAIIYERPPPMFKDTPAGGADAPFTAKLRPTHKKAKKKR